MTLKELKEGESGRIIGFINGCEEFKKRMDSLGFNIGDIVYMEKNSRFAPIKVSSNRCRNPLAICKGKAEKILIQKI